MSPEQHKPSIYDKGSIKIVLNIRIIMKNNKSKDNYGVVDILYQNESFKILIYYPLVSVTMLRVLTSYGNINGCPNVHIAIAKCKITANGKILSPVLCSISS